ncbi:hypothetical protein F4677DRAFT_461856 [Hypoxylon crocopeplum]|nr:hypothetical protein F4677DRAFT_461856 [Hypoxylon crocopeplum]
MAVVKFLTLFSLPLFVRGQVPAPSYLYPGCVHTGCGTKSCPSGLRQHIRTYEDSGGNYCDAQDSLVCCPFQSRNAQWVPTKPTDGHHACPTSNPCPSQNQILVYADPRGPGGNVCLDPGPGSSYWYCEDQPVPNPVSSVGKYTYQGCYSDSSNAHALSGGSYTDYDKMTVDVCAQKAAAAGATYFGVEYYGECYWGNSISSSSKQQDASKCTSYCAGNQQQACGGLTGQIGLYVNPSNVVPKELSSYKTWSSQGCYSDSGDSRSLPNTYAAPSGTAMTVEVCCDAAAGFKYAAVEYGKECYYGNYLASTASKQSSGCNMQCAGSPSELCGGGNRVNLYLNSAYSQPATEKPSVGSFSSMGCYTDSSSARGLTAGSSKSSSMTVEQCVQLAAGHKYAAIEYGTECYWGDTLSSTSKQANGQCTIACGGDSKELCGDGNRMNVYINSDFTDPPTTPPTVGSFTYLGCFVDDPASRVLPNQNQDTSMTVERCITLATAGNAKYAGLENGNQCFFGTNLTASGSDGCTKACVGNSLETCGGSRRLAIYENKSYDPGHSTTTKSTTAPPSSTPISTMSSSTITTSTTTTTKPTPTVVSSVGSFSNQGCFFDQETPRVLVADSMDDSQMTVEKCVKFADDGSWRYAGVEFGSQCFVGNTLHGASGSSSSDCNQACPGNPAEVCGASNRIGIYQDSAWVDPTADQLADVLQEYNSTLVQVLDAIDNYKSHIQQLKDLRNQKKRGLDSRLAVRQSQTETILLQDITRDSQQMRFVTELLDKAARNGNHLFINAANNDVDRPTSPLVNSDSLSQLQEATQQASEVLSEVTEAAVDDAASIASAESSSPLLDLERDLGVAGGAVSTIGKAGVATGVGAATGIFLTIVTLFGIFHHGGGNTGGGTTTVPPPTSTTISITTSSTTTSSSSTCSPTQSPTPVIVLTTRDSTRNEFDTLLSQLKINDTTITNQIVYDSINFRAFAAELDDCDVGNLQGNKIVSTISRNIQGKAETSDDSSSTKRDSFVRGVVKDPGPILSSVEVDEGNYTMLGKRAIPDEFRNLYVASKLKDDIGDPYPFHLDWLTSPWAQRGLTGSYLGFEHYLFEQNANLPVNVRVYVLDTGAREDHWDIKDKIVTSYDATRLDQVVTGVTDKDNHGTCMSSCVGGVFAGVFKQANIVPIKFMETGNAPPTLLVALNAIALALKDKDESGVEAGVMSMSFGFEVKDLKVVDGQPENTVDPFADLLERVRDANIVAVASSGNEKSDDIFSNTPRKNGGADTAMIVVGAATHTSDKWEHSTFIDSSGKGILSIYAIGQYVVCAAKNEEYHYRREDGSSPATAQVAGIVAMYLAQGRTTVPNAKAYLLAEAARLKGTNWANDGAGAHPGPGPLRAGIGRQISCTGGSQATEPAFEIPDKQIFADEILSEAITEWDDVEPDCVIPMP